MNKTSRIVRWYSQLNLFWRSTAQSALIAGSYVASIGEKIVQDIFEANKWNQWLFPKLITIALLISIFLAVYAYINSLAEANRKEIESRRNTLLYAYSLIDQHTVGQIEFIDRSLIEATDQKHNGNAKNRFEEGVISFISSSSSLMEIVKCVYSVFESQYGRSEQVENRVDFEVTFMTKSYSDGEITIPAYANRSGRQPVSMSHRSENKTIYRKTITAAVYNEAMPRMRIIPDTVDPSTGYTELYSGQRDRIRSTLIFPVMCDKNRILGTLVVHCNEPGFFQERDRRFWNELLEIFGKRISVEKIRLDAVNAGSKLGGGDGSILGKTIKPPF